MSGCVFYILIKKSGENQSLYAHCASLTSGKTMYV